MSEPQSFLESMSPAAFLNALGDPVFVLDGQTCVRYANPQAEKLLGPKQQSLIGQRFEDLVSDDDLMAITGLCAGISSDVERNLSILLKTSDDTCVQVNATLSKIVAGTEGGIAGYIVICRDAESVQEILSESSRMAAGEAERADVEARARDEAELREHRQTEEAQTRKLESIGQLAAGVAHEINTPIQFIRDNLQFLRDSSAELLDCVRACRTLTTDKLGRPEEALEKVAQAIAAIELAYLSEELPSAFAQTLDGANRVARIVRAMKDFAHPSNGKRSPLDLREAIETTITLARNEWSDVAEVKVEADADFPQVMCVADEFKQVILNMLVNACHGIGDRIQTGDTRPGRILFGLRAVEEWAEIRICDNGIGIPQENIAKIFDPFFTTKEVGRGTGQGLSLAYTTIVRRHNGQLDVASTPGEGATFTIRIPLKGAPDDG